MPVTFRHHKGRSRSDAYISPPFGQDLDGTSQDGQVTKRRLRAQQPGRWSETFASETAPSASQAGDPPDFSRIQSGAGIACRAPVTSNRSIACCYSRGLVSAQLSDAVVEWALAAVGGDHPSPQEASAPTDRHGSSAMRPLGPSAKWSCVWGLRTRPVNRNARCVG